MGLINIYLPLGLGTAEYERLGMNTIPDYVSGQHLTSVIMVLCDILQLSCILARSCHATEIGPILKCLLKEGPACGLWGHADTPLHFQFAGGSFKSIICM